MKIITITFLFFMCIGLVYAQNPLVKQWDKRFGGTSGELMYGGIIQTVDAGLMMGGISFSDSSGNKTQHNRGAGDYWIVKTDIDGNILWEKGYGGAHYDALTCFQQTSDNGYILGGISYSDKEGDKTQPNWDTTHTYADYWIVKIDAIGNKMWDKRFGGTNHEACYTLTQTSDGGYLIGGLSGSGITGDKTQASWGDWDYWIVKTDSLGNKLWDKRYGGFGGDVLWDLKQTYDGGYILGGWSYSGISGDKTQASWGDWDYWIVKIDSIGNKLWDKRFGGSSGDLLSRVHLANNRGFLLGGSSFSGISGDKSQPGCGLGDAWLVKIDSLGNQQWDRDFGGNNTEFEIFDFIDTDDSGFMISARSESDSSCNKSEDNLGLEQSWFVKLDSLGIKQWDKTVFTNYQPQAIDAYVVQTTDGCYVFGNSTTAGIGGEKTVSSWAPSIPNFWIIKFCDTTSTTGLQYISNSESILVYPNPFNNDLTITLIKQNPKLITYTIGNTLGQILYRKTERNLNNTCTTSLDLSFLPNGIYLLEVIIDGIPSLKKILKK